mmetsp:Transcript_32810/g.91884  ORF Transcript_32810/g.91884 Transcript_32810/m.91884 type:complete len:125 (+) Transcript_32810:141-515(+)|eukprot:CAMPEP_0119132460 /NCGR_PEP_ID=MMETSP1310-20130426/11850_1 /TAXON_ID=464262 /ORGANISM="Genus nov. species nov., Strain RCC2339" /LENGTH=124 /DNA_ID=CAMNT_0007123095 /DNA_START=107 /DNA_END=481 /DNA_ORIENTATION=-
MASRRISGRLPPDVNRILYVRNLPFKITPEELYDIFGKYGPVLQIRLGEAPDTKGTAFVIYEDIFDAKNACEHLSGFNVGNRYLIVLYHKPVQMLKKMDPEKRQERIDRLKHRFGVEGLGAVQG